MNDTLVITGDKPEFLNYLKDNIEIPKNAGVALSKASFSIPVIAQSLITMPYINPSDYGKIAFIVVCDGIRVSLSWSDIYDAYIDLIDTGGIEDPAEIDANDFYGFNGYGTKELECNNFKYFIDTTAGAVEEYLTLPGFTQVLSAALNSKFYFYDFESADTYLKSNKTTLNILNRTLSVNIDGTEYDVNNNEIKIKEFGLVCKYNPNEVSSEALDENIWTASDLLNFTGAGTDTLTDGGAGNCVGIGNDIQVDLNGGFYRCNVSLSAGTASFGFINIGKGARGYIPSTALTNTIIDIGFEFTYNAAGSTYQIIHGQFEELLSHGGSVDTYYDSNLHPVDSIISFNNTDTFFIHISRGEIVDGTNSYVFSLFHGLTNNINANTTELVYRSKNIVINNPLIEPTPIFLSNGNGNIFGVHRYISLNPQTTEQINFFKDSKNITTMGSLDIIPTIDGVYTNPTAAADDANFGLFFDSLNLHPQRTENFSLGNARNNAGVMTLEGNVLSKVLKWKCPHSNIKYYLGVRDFTKTFNNAQSIAGNITFNPGIVNIPRQIEISILNWTNEAYSGSFLGNSNFFDTSTISKVVSFINTDKEYLNITDNTNLDYIYEAYNLIYRKLRNPQSFITNQLRFKLGYKDFLTNKEGVIDTLYGIVKAEFNITQLESYEK